MSSLDQPIDATDQELRMNNPTPFAFPNTDTVLSVLMVGGLAFVSALMVAVAGLQAVVA